MNDLENHWTAWYQPGEDPPKASCVFPTREAYERMRNDPMRNEELEEALAGLILGYAQMWGSEWGGGEDDWPEMLAEFRGPKVHPEVRRALEVLGLTWEEFVARSRG